MTNHLHRELAPISDAAWAAIEEEARSRLKTHLAARKLVDFDGPHGWDHSASNLGRIEPVAEGWPGVTAVQRRLLPLVELRVPFTLSRAELNDVDRGAGDADLGDLDRAAMKIAVAENATAFHGYEAAGMRGIIESSPHPPMTLSGGAEQYPNAVARGVDVLRSAGIDGPYGLAISPDIYTVIVETTEHGGLLLFDHLRQILGGPLVWAPGLDGGVVLSLRGGDFVLDAGEDLSIGYSDHDADAVRLYLEESFSFRVREAEAAIALTVP